MKTKIALMLSFIVLFGSKKVFSQNNLGFELWQDGIPTSWGMVSMEELSMNLFATIGDVSTMPLVVSTPAFEGNKAIKMTTFELQNSTEPTVEDGIYGALISQVFSIEKHIESISFQYKLNLIGSDRAVVVFETYDDDGSMGQGSSYPNNIITRGYQELDENKNDWTYLSVPLVYNNVGIPQSCRIAFLSSIGQLYPERGFPKEIGTTLEIDDIQITYQEVTKVLNNHINKNWLYPNPASNLINISSENVEIIKIFNLTGKEVLNIKINNNQIDISHLDNGIYFCKIISKNGKTLHNQKLVIKR